MNSTNKQEVVPQNITNGTEKRSAENVCCGIYGLRNKINNKWYVGQSIDIHDRWHLGYELMHCKGQPKIYRALKKYGYDNFDKVIIEECENVDWILDYRETHWIRELDSIKNGYNLKEGGAAGKMSEETRKKIAAARTGKHWSDEHIKTLSDAAKLACNKPEFKEKISKSWIKRRLIGVSSETKKKMTTAKFNQSIETRAKISAASKKYRHTEESKNKIREARKQYWEEKRLTKI